MPVVCARHRRKKSQRDGWWPSACRLSTQNKSRQTHTHTHNRKTPSFLDTDASKHHDQPNSEQYRRTLKKGRQQSTKRTHGHVPPSPRVEISPCRCDPPCDTPATRQAGGRTRKEGRGTRKGDKAQMGARIMSMHVSVAPTMKDFVATVEPAASRARGVL